MNIISNFIRSLSEEEVKDFESELEKEMKLLYGDIAKELEKTVIHKIAIGEGRMQYLTFGEVTGHVLNQFSMDESGGYFRIATTKNRTWSRYAEEDQIESYSNLYVLDEDLKQVGAVEGLAKGERIYSVRFMQDRAYMVTFKQVDPLFVIGLEDPANPVVLGELKIPGFSNYLHPYDDNLLIGIGKDAKENEWGGVTTHGVKFSLFDVSDVSSPREVDNHILGGPGSDSVALRDHKAFLFSKEKELLAIPVTLRDYTSDSRLSGLSTENGAAVLRITPDGFDYRKLISHENDNNYYNNIRRCLYINNVLYTFSDMMLKMNDLEDLSDINEVKLRDGFPENDHKVINR